MKKTDRVYLQDILESINQINKFLGEMKFVAFSQDDKTQFAAELA